MNILVFGASGQVGRALDAKPNTICVTRADADLSDPLSCARLIERADVDGVINAAAMTAVDAAERRVGEAFVVNARAPAAMAIACERHGLPFVHLSTDYVFNGTGNTPWRPDDLPDPLQVYGRSKLAGEDAVRAVGGCHAILRTSWVFSATSRNFVSTILRAGHSRGHVSVVNDQIGAPTPATSIAEAAIEVIQKLKDNHQVSGTSHFSGDRDVSWAGFAARVFEIADLDVEVRGVASSDYATLAVRPLNSRLCCNSLTQTFGIEPVDWGASLPKVVSALNARSKVA